MFTIEKDKTPTLNIYQKLAGVRKLARVVQKNKDGYGYRYADEEAVLQTVTNGMDKFRVTLIPNLDYDSITIEPVKVTTKKGETTEFVVKGKMNFTWINDDNPEEKVEVTWLLIGQQGDSAQAFGAGLTYCNRYFLMKYFQMATTEADPDFFRSKQKEMETNAIVVELKPFREQIIALSGQLIKLEIAKEDIYGIIKKHNNDKANPQTIMEVSVAENIIADLTELKTKAESRAKQVDKTPVEQIEKQTAEQPKPKQAKPDKKKEVSQ